MRLLIVGATGLVGAQVVRQALADARITRVITLSRRAIAAQDKLETVVIDFANMPVQAPWWSVDAVVCALGTTRAATRSAAEYRAIDHDYPLAVARHARDHGATRFALTSSLGANARSRFVYTRQKGELEDALQALGFPSLTIVRPSILGGHRAQKRAGEGMALAIFGVMAPLLPRHWRVSPATAVATTLLQGVIDGSPGVVIKTNADMEPAP